MADKMKANLRILVVDDQESMRALISLGLKGLGVSRIATAESGARALSLLHQVSIDLVLLDGEMPQMSGLETLRAMRRDPTLAKMPVIMVTGVSNSKFVSEAVELGISGYLVKPLSFAALGARLDALCGVKVQSPADSSESPVQQIG